MSNLRYAFSGLTKAYNALVEQGKKDMKFVNVKLHEVEPNIDEMEMSIHTVKAKMVSLDQAVEKLMAKVVYEELNDIDRGKVDEQVDKVPSILQESQGFVDRLEGIIAVFDKKKLRDKPEINAVQTKVDMVETNVAKVKLPKLELPTFSGDKWKWKDFWTSFEEDIHKATISDLTKFKYLLNALKGDARVLISQYELNGDNYEKAIELLQKRYNNSKDIIIELTNKLRKERSRSSNLDDQQKLYDRCVVIVDQLRRYKQDVDSQMVKEQVLSKFEVWIQREILKRQAKLTSLEEWTMDVLMSDIDEVMCSEMQISECLQRFDQKGSQKMDALPKTPKIQMQINQHKQNKSVCHFCRNNGHFADKCIVHKTPKERKDAVDARKNQCCRCLRLYHTTKECRSDIHCDHCNGEHHTLLCLKKSMVPAQQNAKFGPQDGSEKAKGQQQKYVSAGRQAVAHTAKVLELKVTTTRDSGDRDSRSNPVVTNKLMKPKSGYLPTLFAKAFNPKIQGWEKIAVLFDSGADNSYITRKVADDWHLPIEGQTTFKLHTFGVEHPTTTTLDITNLRMMTNDGEKMIRTMISESLVGELPRPILSQNDVQFLKLNDADFDTDDDSNDRIEPDLVIGTDYLPEMWKMETLALPSGIRVMKTELGYAAFGRKANENEVSFVNSLRQEQKVEDVQWLKAEDFQERSEDFTGPVKMEKHETDEKVWQKFNETIEKRDDGYYVRLPYKPDYEDLPDNYQIAIQRLKSVVKNHPIEVLERIDEVFKDQLAKNIIEEAMINEKSNGIIHYNPHQPVITPNKTTTKLRVVIDGSSHLKNERSLNDVLHQGPVILPESTHMLLRFRSGKTAMIADVEKAFLQVHLHEDDRDATRVLWIKDVKKGVTKENLICYRFRRVIFGLNTSPFLLAATIAFHLNDEGSRLAEEILDNLYVDNLILTTDDFDEEKLKWIYERTKKLFDEMHMNLREYATNNSDLRKLLNEVDKMNETEMKVLGVRWNTNDDMIEMRCDPKEIDNWTKRSISSTLGAIYDPIGLLAPLLLPLKLLMSKIWTQNLDWDQQLTEDLMNEAKMVLENMAGFKKKLPREAINKSGNNSIIVCSDASSEATACCAYAVQDGTSHLIFGKTKVKPPKETWTIPKLEMQALVNASELLEDVYKSLKDGNIHIGEVCLLSDSECVLGWMKSPPGKKEAGVFITNRIRKVRMIVEKFNQVGIKVQFGYINTKCNPADVGTRGITKDEFAEHIWWTGPQYFVKKTSEWPKDTKLFSLEDVDADDVRHVNFCTNYDQADDDLVFNIKYTNSMPKMRRIASYVNRFIWKSMRKLNESTRSRFLENHPEFRTLDQDLEGEPEVEEVQAAEISRIRDQQKLMTTKRLKELQHLNLKLDEMGLIRCHGRLQNAEMEMDAKRPILINQDSHLAVLIVNEVHGKYHRFTSQTMTDTRKKYWIPKLRQMVKKKIKRCVKCQRFNNAPFDYPKQEDLPEHRVRRGRPFQYVGIDYFGPLKVKGKPNEEHQKAWGCIITCQITRMTFLDLAEDLTTASFLNILRRFFSSYATPEEIMSDNAPTFTMANEILQEARRNAEYDDSMSQFLTNHEVKWKFITPYAPWKGGCYERLIRNIKEAMFKSIGRNVLSHDELRTTLTEIASILNHRPLTYAEADLEDDTPIRPIDFIQSELKMHALTQKIWNKNDQMNDEYLPPIELAQIRTQKEAQEALKSSIESTEKFWKIFQDSYLNELRERHKLTMDSKKSSILKPEDGQVVLVADPNLPRYQWRLARIKKTKPSPSGAIRELHLMVPARQNSEGWKKRIIRRPPNLVIPLEIPDIPNDLNEIEEDEMEQEVVEQRYNMRQRKPVNYDEEARNDEDQFSHINASVTRSTNMSSRFVHNSWIMLAMLSMFLISTTEAVNGTFACIQNGIRIDMEQFEKVQMCAKNYCTTRERNKLEKFADVWIPIEIKMREHLVRIKGLNGLYSTYDEVHCQATPFCKSIDCTFCVANLANPECNPTIAIAGIVLVVYLLATCIYVIFQVPIRLGGPCYWTAKIGWKLFTSTLWILRKLFQCFGFICARIFRRRRRRVNLLDDIDSKLEFILLTMLMLTNVSKGCQEVDVFHESNKICDENQIGKCHVVTKEILSLNPMNREACIRLTKNDSMFKEIRVKFVAVHLECEKETMTFTRDIELKTISSKRCAHMGTCQGEKCAAINRTSIVEELDEGNGHVGMTGCVASCGGIGCDCFYPSSACLFYRIFGVPQSPTVYEIFRCGNWKEYLDIDVEISRLMDYETETKRHRTRLELNSPASVGNHTINLKSIHIPTSPILNTWFIQSNQSAAQWEKDELPTLQCDSEDDAAEMNCSFVEKCKCDSAEAEMKCQCEETSIAQRMLDFNHNFPVTTPNFIFSRDGENGVQAKLDQATSAEISITIIEDAKITIVKTTDKCSIESSEAVGCYNCEDGAKTSITCRSTKREVIGDIDCSNEHFAVTCTPDGHATDLRFFPLAARFYRKCKVSCNGKNFDEFEVQGLLKFTGNVWDASWRIINGDTKVYDEMNWPDLSHIGQIYMDFMKTTILAVVGIGLIGLLIFMLTQSFGMMWIVWILKVLMKIIWFPFKLIAKAIECCLSKGQIQRRTKLVQHMV